MSRSPAFLLFLLFAASLVAQPPAIYPRGVVNAASYMPPGLPGGGIARGSAFTIFGSNLGPVSSPALAFPLSTTLGGVSIKVIAPNAGPSVDAIPIFVSPGQINAIMPSNAPLGMVSIQLSFNNLRSNFSPVRVVGSSFGIFTASSSGLGPGALQNFVSPDVQPINSPMNSAAPGQVITLYGTGLGPGLGPDNVAPTAGNLPVAVEVWVGGQRATSVPYSGRSPCCSGIDQIVFQVPDATPPGCWVPIYVRTASATTSNVVTMAIQPGGGPCSEQANPLAQKLLNGGNLGAFLGLRAATHEDVGVLRTVDVTSEFFGVGMSAETGGQFAFNPLVSLPPASACTVYTAAGDLFAGGALGGVGTTGRYLDAGASFSLIGPKGNRALKPLPLMSQLKIGFLGFNIPGLPYANSLFLDPGDYMLNGSGGPDVGAFQAALTIAPLLNWTNRDQTTMIDRSQGLTVNWTGGAGQTVGVIGGNVDLPTNSSALFLCLAAPGATSMTVPAAILSNVPATRTNILQSKSVVYVGTVPLGNPGRFSATGLDIGLALPTYLTGKTVIFR